MIRKVGRKVFTFWFAPDLSIFDALVFILVIQEASDGNWWLALFYFVVGLCCSGFFEPRAVKMMGNPKAETRAVPK